MKRASENGLDVGGGYTRMRDTVETSSRDMGWNILQDLTTIMILMTSIEHRNVPQNISVTSKRSLLGIVRLRLATRVA